MARIKHSTVAARFLLAWAGRCELSPGIRGDAKLYRAAWLGYLETLEKQGKIPRYSAMYWKEPEMNLCAAV